MTARGLGAYAVALALAMTLSACGAGGERERTDQPQATDGETTGRPDEPLRRDPSPTATDPGPSYSDWELGAHPLPLRPDGLGEMRPTPPELAERRFPTRDLLPPPGDGRFHSTTSPVTASSAGGWGRRGRLVARSRSPTCAT